MLSLLCAITSSATAQDTREDGATELSISIEFGSLQNPCWIRNGSALIVTWFTEGYNLGPAGLLLIPDLEAPMASVFVPAGDTNVNMPGSCWDEKSGTLVFTSDPDGPDKVFTTIDGHTLQQITSSPQIAWEPTFSPDGEWIVFESHLRGPEGEIWKVRADGTELVQLTSGANDRQPNWGPDNLIVFQRHEGGQVDLWVMDANGDGARNVTRTPELEETDASWSPSGDWLVFSSDGPGVDHASLFVIGADNDDLLRVTTADGVYDGAPSWSPDGKTIAFESYPGDPDNGSATRIWTIDVPAGRK